MLRQFRSVLVLGALLLVASIGQGVGYNGRFDALASSISGAVASGNKTAVAIDKAIRATSTSRSKDFATLAKIVKLAAKDEYQTVSEQTLTTLFGSMVTDTGLYGVSAFSALAQRIVNDPTHAVKLARTQAKYFASQVKGLGKYDKYWGDADPGDEDLAKAASAYAAIAKLYELIAKLYD